MDKTTIDGAEYKEVKINKVVVNGKEQSATIIYPEQVQGHGTLNITLYANTPGVSEEDKVNKEDNEAK